MRTQRILGRLIAEGQDRGEIRKQAEHHRTSTSREVVELGITHKQSSTFQQIATIPEDGFEELE